MMIVANKVKKISINALEKCIERRPETVDVEWNGLDITIKTRLSFEEMMAFVDGVVQGCFTTDDNSYVPEAKDFVIKCYIVETYSNIKLPQNVNKKYDILYTCDISNFILDNIDQEQFGEIVRGIDTKLKYLVASNINAITVKINELLSGFSNIEDRASQIFEHINQDNIDSIIKAIGNSRIDESKLMDAYLRYKSEGGS